MRCGSVPPRTRSAPSRRTCLADVLRDRRRPAAARCTCPSSRRRTSRAQALRPTPTALIARHGLLGPDHRRPRHPPHRLGHRALGSAGTTVCFCPTTERDLADGIGPAGRLSAAGAPLSLGSDQHAVIDLLEEARGARDARAAGVVAARALLAHRDAHLTHRSPQPGLARRRPAGDRRPRRSGGRTHRQRAHRRRRPGAAAAHRHRGRRSLAAPSSGLYMGGSSSRRSRRVVAAPAAEAPSSATGSAARLREFRAREPPRPTIVRCCSSPSRLRTLVGRTLPPRLPAARAAASGSDTSSIRSRSFPSRRALAPAS